MADKWMAVWVWAREVDPDHLPDGFRGRTFVDPQDLEQEMVDENGVKFTILCSCHPVPKIEKPFRRVHQN